MKTTRKLTKTLLTLALLLVLAPALAGNAKAAAVETWSADITTDARTISGDVDVTESVTLTINKDKVLTVNGTIHIADGKTLTVAGPGVLNVSGSAGSPAVTGALIVTDGKVNLNGGSGGPGVDGGHGIDGSVTLYSGSVNASGGKGGDYEYGGGNGGSGVNGNVILYGGWLDAKGGLCGDGSGDHGGHGGNGGNGVSGNADLFGGVLSATGRNGGIGGRGAVNGDPSGNGGIGGDGVRGAVALSGGTLSASGGPGGPGGIGNAGSPPGSAGTDGSRLGGGMSIGVGLTYKDDAGVEYTDAGTAKAALNAGGPSAQKTLYLGWESAQAKLGTLTNCKELYPGGDFYDGVNSGTITSVATVSGKTLVCNRILTVGGGSGTLTVSGGGALTFAPIDLSAAVIGLSAAVSGNLAVKGGTVEVSSECEGVDGSVTVYYGGTFSATGGSGMTVAYSGVVGDLTLAGGTATVTGGRRLMGGGTADSVGGTAQIAPGFVYRVGGVDYDSGTDSDTIKTLLKGGAVFAPSTTPPPTAPTPAPVSAGSGNSAPPEPFRQTLPAALVFDGGKVEISPVRAGIGDMVTLTVTPDAGKKLERLSVDRVGGEPLPYEDKGGGVYEFEMPGWRLAFRATFGSDAQPEPEQQPLPSDNVAGVVLSPQTITVNGAAVKVEAYNIGGTNFFMLRDLAALLSGTSAQFDVAFDADRDAVVVTTGEAYAGEVNESFSDRSRRTVPSQQSVELDGQRVSLTAYNIGGNNFFGLRELSTLLGYGVAYDEATNTAIIESK